MAIGDRRLACVVSTDYCDGWRFAVDSGQRRQGFGEDRREILRFDLVGLEADDAFVYGVSGGCGCFERESGVDILPDHDDLGWRQKKLLQREAVGSGVEAEVLDDAGEVFKRVFGFFAQGLCGR